MSKSPSVFSLPLLSLAGGCNDVTIAADSQTSYVAWIAAPASHSRNQRGSGCLLTHPPSEVTVASTIRALWVAQGRFRLVVGGYLLHSGESSGMRLTEGAAAGTSFHGDGEREPSCAMWAT